MTAPDALQAITSSSLFMWVGLPLLIFCARVIDVTLGTLRIIFLSSRQRFLAPLLGFFEVLIWVIVVSELITNLSSPISYLAYAAGFATGNMVGIFIENRLAIGTLMVRIITVKPAADLIQQLRAAGYGVTSIDAHGTTGQASVIYSIVKRKELDDVLELVRGYDPKLFISVDELHSSVEGIFRPESGSRPGLLRLQRKGK